MTHASPRCGGRTASRSRALARFAVLAGLFTAVPFALAQEVAAPEEATDRAPGTASEVRAIGWGNTPEFVTHVEGAVEDAPLTPIDKPIVQNDHFVQRLSAGVPKSLNPLASDEPGVAAIGRHMFDRLIDVDPDRPPEVVGALAVSWEVSDDGRTCTYRLRRGVQFADGSPFTSADVVFSFAVARDEGIPAEHMRSAFDRVDSVEATDDHTVVVKFRGRHWNAPYVVGRALPVVNRVWYVEQIEMNAFAAGSESAPSSPGSPGFAAAFAAVKKACPGTGPYYVANAEDVSGRSIELSPNPFSWQMQVYPARHNFARLRWVDLPTEGDAFHAFVHGNLDVWVVSHAMWEHQLSRDPRVDNVGTHLVYDHIGIDASAIFWNCRDAPFDDANVRKAMTMLTDRETILQRVEQGHGTIAACKSKRSYPTYSTDIEPHPFDTDQAEVHLIRAGWSRDTDGDGILDRKGKPFSFELTYPAGRREFDMIAQELEIACRKVNIEMKRNPLGSVAFADAVRRRKFQAIVGHSAWAGPWIDLHGRYHKKQDVKGGGNITGWHTKEVDELLEEMTAELDEEKRTALFHRFNKIFHDEQPETLLVHGKVGVLVNKRLQGVSIRPTGLQSFDLWVAPDDVRHGKVDTK